MSQAESYFLKPFLEGDLSEMVSKVYLLDGAVMNKSTKHNTGATSCSQVARLAAKFAGIARIEIAADKTPALKVALVALEADGFNLNIEGAAVEAAPGGVAGASGAVFNLELLGPDHPGIVRDVTHCLSEQGVSVEEMQTNLLRAPMGGDILFQAQARVRLPDDLSEDSLRDALEALAEALMVDLTLREGDA